MSEYCPKCNLHITDPRCNHMSYDGRKPEPPHQTEAERLESALAESRQEVERLQLELSASGKIGYAAEDAECLHQWLDDRNVPRGEDVGDGMAAKYSLVGRVTCLLEALHPTQPAEGEKT